jgi:hypothetical protein
MQLTRVVVQSDSAKVSPGLIRQTKVFASTQEVGK